MIPQTDLSWQDESWQSAIKNLITDARELCQLLQLTPEALNLSEEAAKQFVLKVPRSFVARMQIGNAKDPLLLQVLNSCLLYTSPSPRDRQKSRMPSSA